MTCIKWVPNSVNLFLVGYSSGNIYLYDANYQAQATVAPTYTKHIHTDSYSVFINVNSSSSSNDILLSTSSSSSSSTSQATSQTSSGIGSMSGSRSTGLAQQNQQVSTNSSLLNQLSGVKQSSNALQLNLSNLHQPIQVAKNPLVRASFCL